MLDFQQMVLRFLLALVLGALIGIEREMVGKEAGVKTAMLVSGGAAIFSMIALVLPSIVSNSNPTLATGESGFLNIIANIVVGVGFLGAGIIIKNDVHHVKGITTAAAIWATAAVGVLAGIGLTEFAVFSAIAITVLLYALRKFQVDELIRPDDKE